MIFSNREIVTASLAVIVFCAAIFVNPDKKDLFSSISTFLKSLTNPKILWSFFLLFSWIALCSAVGSLLGWWSFALLKDTILLALFFGIPVLFHSGTESKNISEIFSEVRRETLGISTLALFYMNITSFSIVGEIIVQLIAAAATLFYFTAIYEEKAEDTDYTRIKKFFVAVLLLAGSSAIFWTTYSLVFHTDSEGFEFALKSLWLNIWLPFATIPFLYFFAYLTGLDQVYARLSGISGSNIPLWLKLVLFVKFNFSLSKIKKFDGNYNEVAFSKNFSSAISFMNKFNFDFKTQMEKEKYRLLVLDLYKGISGVDDHGFQKDRRQYWITKRFLEEVGTAQTGQMLLGKRYFNERSNNYKEILSSKRYVSLQKSEIKLETDKRGKTWRAYRELPNGWFLAIGSKNKDRLLWYYSEPAAPRDFPHKGSDTWFQAITRQAIPQDWQQDDDVYSQF